MTLSAMSAVGIDVSGRVIVLEDLESDLETGGVAVPNGLTIAGPPRSSPLPYPAAGAPPPPCPDGSKLFTCDGQGNPIDLPPEAAPIVAAYTPTVPT